jgi:hypothetical protein
MGINQKKQKKQIKSEIVSLRFSLDELDEIKRKAALAGVKHPSFIRKALENSTVKQSNQLEQKEVIYHLKKIGNNINQIAKVINTANLDGEINDKLADNIIIKLAKIENGISKC